MGERQEIISVSDEEAFLFAMQLAGASAVPMVLKSALELGIIDTIAKAGPGAQLSPSKLPTIKNPDAPAMLDRLLRLLASYRIFTYSLPELPHGGSKAERHYGLAPLAKYFVNNEDGVPVVASFLMQHDKVLKDMWYHLTDSIQEGGLPFDNAYGMTSFEFHGTNPRFNTLFKFQQGDV